MGELRVSFGKVRLVFSFWFFAALLLFVLLDHEVLLRYIALPIVLHECGHLAAMTLLGAKLKEIRFTPFSVAIVRASGRSLSLWRELVIQLAGAAVNLACALLLYMFWFQSMRVMFLVAVNFVMAAFNLLPVGNLDGGECVRLVCERLFAPRMALTISKFVSFFVLTPLFALSIFLLLIGSGNFTLLAICIYLAVTLIFRD